MFESFVLAGGKSSRMRQNKAFLKLGDETLLEISIATLQEINSPKISVVVAKKLKQFDKLSANFPIILDIYENHGTLGGIHSALANCSEEFTLITACDYPFVSSTFLNYLFETAKKSDADCIAPIQKDGIVQPLCAFYRTDKCLKILTAIVEKFDKTPSARNFLKRINTKFIKFEKFARMPNAENFFFNVNTPQDFERAIETKKLLDEK